MSCGFELDQTRPGSRPLGLPFAPWAKREIASITVASVIGGGAGLAIAWLDGLPGGYVITAAFALLFAFSLFFFRDPRREIPKGEETLLAPADGTVTDVQEVDEIEYLGGRGLRVGIFMSLFDVHVNRVPDDGEVRFVRHRDGEKGNVMFERAWERNENVLIGMKGRRGPFAVRLVAGAVARRIAYDVKAGDEVERGKRMGMVKFGSRAEVIVPVDGGWKPVVAKGQKVKAGRSALFARENESGGEGKP
ncbi:MAG: phosphatidylserine decarboxylase [Planctomycetota bacterium]